MRAILLTGLLALLTMGCEQVSTGHVGVVDSFGEVTGTVVGEGLNFMMPQLDVTEMSIQQMNMDFKAGEGSYGSIKAPARDKTSVTCDATVMFYLNAQDPNLSKNAADVLQKLGPGWYNKLIVANTRTSVRDAVAEFDAMEAATTKRSAVGVRTQEILTQKVAALLTDRGIAADAVVIQAVEMRAITLPDAIKESIEAIQRQKSAALEKERAKDTEKLEQERKLIAQKGQTAVKLEEASRRAEVREIEAKSISAYNKTVNASLTERLLEQQRINATKAILGNKGTTTVFLDPRQPVLFNK